MSETPIDGHGLQPDGLIEPMSQLGAEADDNTEKTVAGQKLQAYLEDTRHDHEKWNTERGQFHPPDYSPEVRNILKQGLCSGAEFDDLAANLLAYYKNDSTESLSYFPYYLFEDISPKLWRDAYLAHSDDNPTAVHNLVQTLLIDDNIGDKELGMQKLMDVYECTDPIQLYQQETEDPLVHHVTENPAFYDIAVTIFWNELRDKYPDGGPERDSALVSWGKQFMSEIAGLPEDLYEKFTSSIELRVHNPDGTYDVGQYIFMLSGLAEAIRNLGAEDLHAIHEGTGIINFDTYHEEQLTRMLKVLRGDEETIDHLKEGDVTVVFRDATGDYNNALGTLPASFESPAGRTVYFEITAPSDVLRYLAMLKLRGIQPSTVVFAAHGHPGGFAVGDPAKPDTSFSVEARPVYSNRDRRISLQDIPLTDIVDRYMQDSRGVDEPTEAQGRRRIILYVCSQDAQVEDLDVGPDSVVTTTTWSAAERLVGEINTLGVDVYAGANPQGGTLTDDNKGLQYTVHHEQADGSVQVEPTTISHLTLGTDGEVIRTALPILPLWR